MISPRFLTAALCVAVLPISAVALAADREAGERALKSAYEQTEGDEGGFGGTLVEQCRAEGDSSVRCVVTNAQGNRDLDSEDYSETRVPLDFGVAHFADDGTITTSREAFTEAVVDLDPDIRVPQRLRRSAPGPLAVTVAPDVASAVTVSAWLGNREIERRPQRSRTVSVEAGRSRVALALTTKQRRRVRTALRRKGSIRAVVTVRVVGDVGPADATELRWADVRVVR